ncbi:MAG TPA: hypothetical protein VD978_12810 [Azospirillum sp.]|nr:hypothetical protein [Azospirillum sp.]
MREESRALRVILILALTAVLAAEVLNAGPAWAQFGLFMGRRVGDNLTDEDWALFRRALSDALRPGTAGSRAEWQNPATNRRGDVVVERVFEKDGAPCGDVHARFIRNTEQQPYRLTFCRNEQGQWLIAP